MRPATEYQNKLKQEYEREHKEYEEKLSAYESAKKSEVAVGQPPEEPVFGRVFVDDTTVEALTPVLSDNKRGLALFKDELTGFIRQMDQYKKSGNDRQFYLSVWGNQPYTVDRKGNQSPIFLSRPFVSLYGGIQPARLPELSKGIEDGMLDRFLFACPEFEFNGWTEDEISGSAREAYQCLYNGLRDLKMGLDEYGNPNPTQVTFSPEAKNLFIEEYDALQAEIKQVGFPSKLQSPWAKMSGYLASLTLLICICRAVETGAEEVVIPSDVMRAKALLSYFKDQARKVYGFLYTPDPLDVLAGDVARFLEYMGGTYEDEPTYLHGAIKSQHKPENPKDLTKNLKDISSRNPDLVVESKSKRVGAAIRRFTKISLRNSVNTVNTVNSADDIPTKLEVRNAWDERVAKPQIHNRMRKGEMNEVRAVDLATRLVLYELGLSFGQWANVEPLVREIVEEKAKELVPPSRETVPVVNALELAVVSPADSDCSRRTKL